MFYNKFVRETKCRIEVTHIRTERQQKCELHSKQNQWKTSHIATQDAQATPQKFLLKSLCLSAHVSVSTQKELQNCLTSFIEIDIVEFY
jgi:hypothetical protein